MTEAVRLSRGGFNLPNLTPLLAEQEAIIERGQRSFVEMGQALRTIKQGRLYRRSYKTFEEYCVDRWQLSRQHAYRLIAAAEFAEFVRETRYFPRGEKETRILSAFPRQVVLAFIECVQEMEGLDCPPEGVFNQYLGKVNRSGILPDLLDLSKDTQKRVIWDVLKCPQPLEKPAKGHEVQRQPTAPAVALKSSKGPVQAILPSEVQATDPWVLVQQLQAALEVYANRKNWIHQTGSSRKDKFVYFSSNGHRVEGYEVAEQALDTLRGKP